MNNQELFECFKLISQQETSLDVACELKKFNKKYKQSTFYKQTKMPINEAYKVFLANAFIDLTKMMQQPMIQALVHGKLTDLALLMEDFLTTFDYTKLDGFFVYLLNKFENLNIDRERLTKLVQTELQSFKSSL